MPLQATGIIGRPDTEPQFRPTFGEHGVKLLSYSLGEKVNISLCREIFVRNWRDM
jgi:hypothetical protein